MKEGSQGRGRERDAAQRSFTTTFTCTLVQQHWNPPPPSPETSLAWARSTYSPGALNDAVVVALPVALSSAGRASPKVTAPGPRNRLHTTLTGDSVGRRSGVT